MAAGAAEASDKADLGQRGACSAEECRGSWSREWRSRRTPLPESHGHRAGLDRAGAPCRICHGASRLRTYTRRPGRHRSRLQCLCASYIAGAMVRPGAGDRQARGEVSSRRYAGPWKHGGARSRAHWNRRPVPEEPVDVRGAPCCRQYIDARQFCLRRTCLGHGDRSELLHRV